jgi:hypothetical protein
MSNQKQSIFVAAAVFASAMSLPAMAHVPYLEGDDTSIGDPISITECDRQERSYYGEISHPADLDVYEIDIAEATPFVVEIQIPLCGGDGAPSIAVVGPGLPAAGNHSDLPFPVTAGDGVVVHEWDEEDTFTELFSGYGYAIGGEIEIPADPGAYTVYVWDPAGNTGDYTVIIGTTEECIFTPWGAPGPLFGDLIAGCGFLTDQQEALYPGCERSTVPLCCGFGFGGSGACP